MVVASEVWGPCYFTGWTAASHWSLTEQVFRTTVLKTTQRVRSSRARLLDNDYLLSHVRAGELAWGVDSVWHEEVRLKIADPVRTVVDVLDEPRLAGGIRHAAEILDTYLDEHDPLSLVSYGDRLGNRTVFKRLGYLVEALGRDEPELLAESHDRISEGIALLDPDAPPEGPRVPVWSLRANARVGPRAPS
jgi:predicted transcriptional regulator of viral defense system